MSVATDSSAARPAAAQPLDVHMIRVLLADDQALVRGGLRLILDAEPDIEVIGEAADGKAASTSTSTSSMRFGRAPQASSSRLRRRRSWSLLSARFHIGDALLAPSSTRRLLEQSVRPARQSAVLATLTTREHEVLQLLARGLTDAEIAGQLYVEPSTVKSHVASLLAKLDLRDRVQAVVFAYEHGIVGAS